MQYIGHCFGMLFSWGGLLTCIIICSICALLGYFVSKENRANNTRAAGAYGIGIALLLIWFSAGGAYSSTPIVCLNILVLVAAIAAIIRFFPFLRALRLQPQIQAQRIAEEQRIHDHMPSVMFRRAVERFQLVPAVSGEPEFRGYAMVASDGEGQSDPLYERANRYSLSKARNEHRLFGNPGVGLKSSDFGDAQIHSGLYGERMLANIIASSGLHVVSFWSLYGKDAHGSRTDADIDAVIIGVGRNGQLYAWFVDAKNYKGGSDTAYVNIADDTLARISISKHAFVSGSDGRADVHMSTNMIAQCRHWRPYLEQYGIMSDWLVCMVPTGKSGAPHVEDVHWPGGVPAMSPETLLARIASLDLADPANIPTDVIRFFTGNLKPDTV
ncbi:hypothetical protein [Bifidobacterium criceti]|uniref:Ftsk solute binding protein, Zinc ribbon domain n=1 Tax=Bifidobacterium criceti TaxID=1960969 RepID=A0A2A2ED91_9BIFI|nr:hypothetical protein [Bifidobacterium criceti]PAU66878.1 Ftsk solute binding protein, Zinc ribbon domain [Bifidobacterium criceti]